MKSENLSDWIQKQPRWAKDALRRLALTTFNDDDKAAIINNLKQDYNIETGIEADIKDFTEENYNTETSATIPKTILCAIGPSKHVNRLADDQVMEFATDGITLIYGDNGSGKSGYCKITKKICRTLVRDHLLGNVFKEGESPKAEVTVRYKTEGEEPTEQVWIDGNEPPEPVSRLTVFDAKCARLYVDKENKIEYLPAEIELLQRYIQLLDDCKKSILPEVEMLQKHVQVTLHSSYTAGGEIAKLIEKLDIKTPANDIPTAKKLKEHAIWKIEDDELLEDLDKQLAENPALKLSAYRTLCASLTNLSDKINATESELAPVKIDELKAAFEMKEATAEAAKLAATERFKNEKLDTTGSNPWQLMYKYATDFAKSIPGNEGKIPAEVGDLCLLCQQLLDTEASERLKRFEQFIADKAAQNAQLAIQSLRDRTDVLVQLNLPQKAEYERLLEQYATISEDRKAIANSIIAFLKEAAELLDNLKECINTQKFTQPAVTISAIGQQLKDDILALNAEIKDLEKECVDNERFERLQEQLANLKDRKRFAADIDIFLQRLEDSTLLANLNKCLAALDTTNTSKKITQLRKTLFTEDLKKNILDEINELDLTHIPFTVESRTDRGTTLVGVNLKTTIPVSNSDVLSEGEQRALALSCFLAEVKREPIQHGIIIDDPVSSLDHLRLRRVAQRLTKEATNRQVVIFTHNILFYSEIKKYAAKYSIPYLEHYIHKSEEKGFGIIQSTDKHWQATPVNKRIELLRTRAQAFTNKTYPDDETRRRDIKDFYTDLRETWERLVEEVLLNNVVGRFDSDVRTQSLAGVIVEDSDYETIYWAMKHASENSGHDKANGNTIPFPKNDEIMGDVKKIEEFRNIIKKRRHECEDRRKALQNPPKAKTI
ncbi:AAA family ATPase [Legionella longbeachae]|nr:AAA family ATPase [Legionella longbeachae]